MSDTQVVDYVRMADGSSVPRMVAVAMKYMTPAVAQDTIIRAHNGESVSGDELAAAHIIESDIIYGRVMGVIMGNFEVTADELRWLSGQITAAMGADLDE